MHNLPIWVALAVVIWSSVLAGVRYLLAHINAGESQMLLMTFLWMGLLGWRAYGHSEYHISYWVEGILLFGFGVGCEINTKIQKRIQEYEEVDAILLEEGLPV